MVGSSLVQSYNLKDTMASPLTVKFLSTKFTSSTSPNAKRLQGENFQKWDINCIQPVLLKTLCDLTELLVIREPWTLYTVLTKDILSSHLCSCYWPITVQLDLLLPLNLLTCGQSMEGDQLWIPIASESKIYLEWGHSPFKESIAQPILTLRKLLNLT